MFHFAYPSKAWEGRAGNALGVHHLDGETVVRILQARQLGEGVDHPDHHLGARRLDPGVSVWVSGNLTTGAIGSTISAKA